MKTNQTMIFRSRCTVSAATCAALLLASCGGSDDTVTPVAEAAPVAVPFTNGVATPSNAVAYWNKIATDTINVAPSATGTAEEQRPAFAVDLATVHVAIYDAVNSIVGTHKAFGAAPATSAAGASQEAAAAAAAHGVLKGLFPNRSAQYQVAYDDFVAAIPPGDAKTRGIAVGTEVATAIVALRANDGRSTTVSYSTNGAPGNFRGVNPIGTNSPFVKPFALTSASQFRAAPPPALDSAAYAADFNEVLALGGTTSSTRTAAQLEAARFHTEAPPAVQPRNYRSFAMDSRSLADNARAMAMLWVAQADASIACFETKYFYAFWRPVSAITLADTDGNAATTKDAAWTPVVPTPNHPEYPSAHMCTNSASMAALKAALGTSKIAFSYNSTVTSTVREYATPDDFLNEIILARIHGGMHFRTANVQGGVLGTNVGEWVAKNYFQLQ
jgi:hypothetical protein